MQKESVVFSFCNPGEGLTIENDKDVSYSVNGVPLG